MYIYIYIYILVCVQPQNMHHTGAVLGGVGGEILVVNLDRRQHNSRQPSDSADDMRVLEYGVRAPMF